MKNYIKLLLIAEWLEDRIAVISTEKMETIKTIDLKGPSRITVARKGLEGRVEY